MSGEVYKDKKKIIKQQKSRSVSYEAGFFCGDFLNKQLSS